MEYNYFQDMGGGGGGDWPDLGVTHKTWRVIQGDSQDLAGDSQDLAGDSQDLEGDFR